MRLIARRRPNLKPARKREVGLIESQRVERVDVWMRVAPPESDTSLEAAIRRHVTVMLVRADGDLRLTAQLLCVDPATLYRWRKAWGLP